MSCRVKVVLRAKWKTAHFKKHLWENSSISNKAAPDENQCSQFSTPKICQWEPASLWVANVCKCLIQTPKSIDPSKLLKLFSVHIYNYIILWTSKYFYTFSSLVTSPLQISCICSGSEMTLPFTRRLVTMRWTFSSGFSRVAIRNNKPFPYGTNGNPKVLRKAKLVFCRSSHITVSWSISEKISHSKFPKLGVSTMVAWQKTTEKNMTRALEDVTSCLTNGDVCCLAGSLLRFVFQISRAIIWN